MPTPTNPWLKNFSDPALVAQYAEGPRRFTPGLEALHRMAAILLVERALSRAARALCSAPGAGWS